MAERAVFGMVAVVAAGAVLHVGRGAGRRRWGLALFVAYTAIVSALAWSPADDAALRRAAPLITTAATGTTEPAARGADGQTVGSSACRSCHPGEHASWHRTFHRTMTTLPSASTVRAPFAGETLAVGGRTVTAFRRDGAPWARLPDPDVAAEQGRPADSAEPPTVERRIVMVTGSHHYQAYWVPGRRGRELRQLPLVWLIESARWIPRESAFLQPPDAPPHRVRWNSSCIQCHAVAGRPAHDTATDRFETSVTELGIACEACHGPGRDHVRRHRNPVTRYAQRLGSTSDPSIVNPARLPPERSAEVCGQCHAYFVPKDTAAWWHDGFANAYRPGDVLDASRTVLDYARDHERVAGALAMGIDSVFWKDGTIRVGGRELNGLRRSACHVLGSGERKMTCLSCHSMHDSEPDDQLTQAALGNGACTGCHADVGARVGEHTHHAAESAGSVCYNCHMPYTTYALFKGIRSHRVDSPSASKSAATGKPNACNQCHLDRTLEWTANRLTEWYGAPRPELRAPMRDVAASLVWMLAGDAAQRVVMVDRFGWDAAHEASGTDWMAPFVAELLDDPYDAVRFVAGRALRTLPGYADFEADFLAPPAEREQASEAAAKQWRGSPRAAPALLLDRDGIRVDDLRALVERRDERPVTISE